MKARAPVSTRPPGVLEKESGERSRPPLAWIACGGVRLGREELPSQGRPDVDSTVSRKLSAAAVTAIAAIAMVIAAAPSAHGAGYARPKGGSPYRTSLVPVFERCETNGGRTADTVHGGPLAYKSCRDPELISGTLTYGTPDANGKQANSVGVFSMTTKVGNPSTPANEADVRVDMSLTDVRFQAGLGDYTGELELVLASRITDMGNGPSTNEPGT